MRRESFGCIACALAALASLGADLPTGTWRLCLRTDRPEISPFYLNGRNVRLRRATSPAPEGVKDYARWAETDPIAVRDGDAFNVTDGKAVWAYAKEPLKDAWYEVADYFVANRVRFVDFAGTRLERGTFAVSLAGCYGRPVRAKVEVSVTDYWQRELFATTEEIGLENGLERRYEYPVGSADSYRACVRVTLPDGLTAVRRYFLRDFRTDTPHRFLDLNGMGWERAFTTDDGTRATRILADAPPASAKWSRVMLPDRLVGSKSQAIYQRWYRRRFTLPKANEGDRYVLHFERPGGHRARVFLNGEKMGENQVWQQGLPLVMDVTKGVRPGENEILVALQGESASCREELFDTAKKLPRSEFYYGEPEREGGVVAECFLETTPAKAIRGIPRVMTSFRKKTIEVADPPLPEGCTISYRVLRQGREVVPPFHGKVRWETPILWGPVEFPLLELEATARDASGRVVDRLSTRFGFREFWTEGMDFIVNGKSVRGVGRSMMPGFGGGVKSWQQTLDGLSQLKELGTTFNRHVNDLPQYYDFADELGIYTSRTSHYCEICLSCRAPRYVQNPLYWDYKTRNELELIDHFPNHASLYTWYISNEFALADNPKSAELMVPVIEAIRAKDPTRFVENGCDLDVLGHSNVISTHYPVHYGLKNEDQYVPDSFYWRPMHDGTWFADGDRVPKGMCKKVCNVGGDSMIAWGGKPISAHETGWTIFMYYPYGPCQVYGERMLSSAGAFGRVRMDYTRWYLEGHRDANCFMCVPWIHPVIANPEAEMPALDAVIPLEYHAFYAGEKVRLDVDVFHDLKAEEDIVFRWRLDGPGGTPVAAGNRTFHADFGAMFRTEVVFDAPPAGRYELVYGMDGREPKRRTIETYERRPVVVPEGAVLVRAEDALDESVVARAREGATVVVLARKDYPKCLPYVPRVTRRDCAINFTFRPGHPSLRGIREEDLRFWFPGHATGHGFFAKPATGGVRTLVECGGIKGFEYAGVIEVPCGRGRILLTRLDLDEASCARNPLAAKLLAALLAPSPAPARGRLGVLADADALARLRAWGVDAEPFAAGGDYAAAWVDGSAHGPAELGGFGGTVFVLEPTSVWGVTRTKGVPKDYTARAVKTQDVPDPVLDGLCNTDFYWRKPGIGERIGTFLTDPGLVLDRLGEAEIVGAEAELLHPRLIVRTGNRVFMSINWRTAHPDTIGKAERIVTTLLANAGVGVTPCRESEPPAEVAGRKTSSEKAGSDAATYAREMSLASEARRRGDVRRAILHLKNAVKADPGEVGACNDLGEAYFGLGDWKRAADWYGKSLKINDNQPPAMEALKECERRIRALGGERR